MGEGEDKVKGFYWKVLTYKNEMQTTEACKKLN